jgi:hypothetical protein
MLYCQCVCKDGTILCIKRSHACFNTHVTLEMCRSCEVGNVVEPEVPFVPTPPPPPYIPGEPRPDLTAWELTLPPFKEGRDRLSHFDADGSIWYERDESLHVFQEPPREINGYERCPSDPYRFIPLWNKCQNRFCTPVRLSLCGCVNFIVRCTNTRCPMYGHRIKHTDCEQCKERIE